MQNNKDTVTAVLDCLLPGDSDWPAAGQHGLGQKFCDYIRESKQGAVALDALLATLGEDFDSRQRSEQIALLESAQSNENTAFEQCVTAAYAVYYTDPVIRQVIERLTGYPARPPQPLGYAMEPFDESLLDSVRQRPPFWRKETDL